jgi:hypothetical protein
MDRSYPVAKLQSVKGVDDRAPVQAWILKNGESHLAFARALLRVGDRVRTGLRTIAALEFFIGGRVGISVDTTVEVVGERQVTAVDMSLSRRAKTTWVLLTGGNRLKQPLEIQTSGGILGTRG